jgi:hypothetical protein
MPGTYQHSHILSSVCYPLPGEQTLPYMPDVYIQHMISYSSELRALFEALTALWIKSFGIRHRADWSFIMFWSILGAFRLSHNTSLILAHDENRLLLCVMQRILQLLILRLP